MKFTGMIVSIIAGLFLSKAGLAKAEFEPLLSMSLEELLEVEITGSTLTKQDLKSVPSAVTVFHHDQIKRLGLDTLDELMNLVPGYQSYRSSASQLDYPFSSRGRRIGTASAEILVLLDGQRLNEARTSGTAVALPRISLKQVERVEFIRGPGSAVYGSNAMLGVINIVSRKGVNEVGFGTGSFDRLQGHLLLSQQTGDLSVDLYGLLDTDNGDTYHVLDSAGGRVVTDDPRAFQELNLKIDWHDTHIAIQHYQYEADNFVSFNGPGNGVNHRESSFSSLSIRQEVNWNTVSSQIMLMHDVSRIEVISQASVPGALQAISDPSSTEPLITRSASEDFSETQLLIANDWAINFSSSLQFGLELRHLDMPEFITEYNYDLNAYNNGDFPIAWYGGQFGASRVTQHASQRDIVGVYGQYLHEFKGATELTLGLRYDNFSSNGSQLSPRIGLVQHLSDHQSIKLLYGEAFRAPSEEELNLARDSSFAGNQNLQPETVRSLELIWFGQWNQDSIQLGFFENRFSDAIVSRPNSSGNVEYINLVADERSRGVELEFSHEFNARWLMRTTYTRLVDAAVDSYREADTLLSAMVNYQMHRWNASISAVYHSDREMLLPDGDRLMLDSYTQVYAKAQYNFNEQWRAYLQVKNISNDRYTTPSAATFLAEGVKNRGREVLVGMVWEY